MQFARPVLGLIVAAAMAGLSGCASIESEKKSEVLSQVAVQRTAAADREHEHRAEAVVPLYERVPGPWVSDRVVPRNYAQMLPAVFDQPFAYRSAEPTSLGVFAADLQRATGIQVRLVGEPVTRPVFLDYVGTGRQALDTIASRFAVSWEYSDGAIVITQSLTKMFIVERSGVDVGGALGGRKDPWAELEASIKSIAPNARISVSRHTNTITVVGAPLAMPDIERLINHDAQMAARRVVLRWQLVNFTAGTGGEAGVQLAALLNRSNGSVSLGGGVESQTPGVGVLSFLKSGGVADGSKLAISLLNQAGNTVVVREGFVPLLQNDTQEFGNTKTLYYASKSSLVTLPATTGNNSNTAVVTEQSSINVGLSGKFGITVFDSEQAELSYEFSVTVLDQLRKQQTAVQYQEYPETSQRRARGRIRIHHGQTYVISTDTAESASFDRRGILPGQAAVLGGNVQGTERNDQWLLLVTPVVTNSAF